MSKHKKPKTLTEKLADSHYQPTRAEMKQEYDMPGATSAQIQKAVFNPVEGPGRVKPGDSPSK